MTVDDAAPVGAEARDKGPRDAKDNKTEGAAAEPGEQDEAEDDETAAEQDKPQEAWAARRDLVRHRPRTMRVGDEAHFGGSAVAGDQHGVSGGHVTGDVILGTKTEIYHLGVSTAHHASGEIPQPALERLVRFFVTDETTFAPLVDRLREERVLVLSGPGFSGRRTAALMLLHRLGLSSVRTLVRDTTPTALAQQLGGKDREARGYLLGDLVTRRDLPLREPHLLAARERLTELDSYLVITVGRTAALEDISPVVWQPPTAADVLAAHLGALTDDVTAKRLLALPAVTDLLARTHQLREIAAFARLLARFSRGEESEQTVADFSLASLEEQVNEWFEEDETALPLREKAFLITLAAFDGGPYALTAELSDLLYGCLQNTQNPAMRAAVPVFGTHMAKRLQMARAHLYTEPEETEWGPVTQSKAAFHDERSSLVLLREVWTGHPSARPGLIAWLQKLADDGRPLVRTRAASTAAVLAYTDLPSAMALAITPLATSPLYRRRSVAVNALAFTYFLDAPNIPRILADWCRSDDVPLRWVAIRTHALIGPEQPRETLAALRGAIRKQYEEAEDNETGEPDELMVRELADSVALLLLSAARETVLAELLRTLDDDQAVRDLALGGFVSACGRTEDGEPSGMPLMLDWYGQALASGEPAAHHAAALWRAALGDRRHTQRALRTLREWVLIADRSEAVEWTLAALLPALAATESDDKRVDHLLRTMSGEDGAPPPAVAWRLRTVLRPTG